MAAPSSNNFLGENLKKTVECPVCLEVYEDPKTLQCGHTLCAVCAEELPREAYNLSQLTPSYNGTYSRSFGLGGSYARIPLRCPVCRQLTIIPDCGLSTNFVLEGVISYVREQQETATDCAVCQSRVLYESQLVCETCSERTNEVSILCVSCGINEHASHAHKVVQRATAFANYQAEALEKVHECAEVARERIASAMNTASKSATVFNDFEFLNDGMGQFEEAVVELQTSNCTKKQLLEKLARIQQLSTAVSKITAEYEAILGDALGRIYELRKQTPKICRGAELIDINIAQPVESKSVLQNETMVVPTDEPQPSTSDAPALFTYERRSPRRDSKSLQRAKILARRRPGNQPHPSSSSQAPSPGSCEDDAA